MNRTYRLQQALCFILFCLIVLGAGVRLANAGLACPDWPLCLGKAVPPFDFQIFMEWIHRVIAGSSGLIALIISVSIFRSPIRARLGRWAVLSLMLFALQGFLGRQTVLELLRSDTVTAHLVGGYSLFALNLLIFLSWKPRAVREPSPLRWGFFMLFVVTFLQAVLGGLVSSHYAGLACAGFPTCNGSWWPEISGAVGFHFIHRLNAFILFFSAVVLMPVVFAKTKDKIFRRLSVLGVGLITLQGIWGISMIYSEVHPALSLAHSATSLAIFATYLVGVHRGFA
jgi:cytochrome c oxidase assembly protein subunit 15